MALPAITTENVVPAPEDLWRAPDHRRLETHDLYGDPPLLDEIRDLFGARSSQPAPRNQEFPRENVSEPLTPALWDVGEPRLSITWATS